MLVPLITSPKSEEAHAELDSIRDLFALEDDAGRPLEIEVEKPLHPASQRLMASLGVVVNVQERTAEGALTADEQRRRHQAFLDEQPMISRCDVDGCDWVAEGPAGDVRALALSHREEWHPQIAKFERRRSAALGRSREALKSGAPVIEPETPTIDPDTPATDPPATPEPAPVAPPVITPATGRRRRAASAEECEAAIRAKVRELGRPFTLTEWTNAKWRPSHPVIRREIGGSPAVAAIIADEIGRIAASDFGTSLPVFRPRMQDTATPEATSDAALEAESEGTPERDKSDLDILRTLNADELIAVGSVLQAVGRVRALEPKDRALPILRRLVGDLHREVS